MCGGLPLYTVRGICARLTNIHRELGVGGNDIAHLFLVADLEHTKYHLSIENIFVYSAHKQRGVEQSLTKS